MANDTNFEADAASLAPKLDFTRRSMMVTTLATGFAASVQPVAAQTTITTDTSGLEAGEVKIKTADGEIPAYRAMPASGQPFCRRSSSCRRSSACTSTSRTSAGGFAKLGYFAIAPELYARQGDVSQAQEHRRDPPDRRQGAGRAGDVRSRRGGRLRQGLRHGHRSTSSRITGFCWGGRDRLALCGAQSQA